MMFAHVQPAIKVSLSSESSVCPALMTHVCTPLCVWGGGDHSGDQLPGDEDAAECVDGISSNDTALAIW